MIQKPLNLEIDGRVYRDLSTRKRFSRDASSYSIQPETVVEPRTEKDIVKVLKYAQETGSSITCRSGGSGLSGAGIGRGIILNFKPFMNRIKDHEKELAVEPGVVLGDLLKKTSAKDLMLPSIPSSSAWCALGGNIGTRSTGPRTARYGTIDAFVTSLRFITTDGNIVDTRDYLPPHLENGLAKIRENYLKDFKTRELFENRPYIAGGYNIKAFSRYQEPSKIATHLMVGSIGTLGIVTEIRLKLIPHRPSLGTYAAFFHDIDELGVAVTKISDLQPAAIEFIDGATMDRVQGQVLKTSNANIAGALLIEFDESEVQAEIGRQILASFDLDELIPISAGSRVEHILWEERSRILPALYKYARKRDWIVPSIIDDVAIHLSDFSAVYKDLRNLMSELEHEISIFGHIGFGSLHARPFFDTQGNIARQIIDVSQQTFQLLHAYGGTLVGEHNAGRSRSVYLEMELGESIRYLREVKNLFDPQDLLNPNTLFNLAPITENMELT